MLQQTKVNEIFGMVGLSKKVAIYVPSTINVSEHIDNSKYVEHALFLLSSLFGGATSTNNVGGYVAQNGELITENVTVVYAYCSDSSYNEENLLKIKEFCEFLKIKMGQECIGIEANNSMFFI
jgi:hypothetical protein